MFQIKKFHAHIFSLFLFYSSGDDQRSHQLLLYLYNQSRRLSEQFQSNASQFDMNFLEQRYEEMYNVLLRAQQSGIFSNIDDILDSLQTLLRAISRQNDNTGDFRPLLIRSGARGRPSWDISEDQLRYLLEYNFSVGEIGQLLCVSYSTVCRRMADCNLSVRMTYSNISDNDLHRLVGDFLQQYPDSGIKTVSGYLNSVGLR